MSTETPADNFKDKRCPECFAVLKLDAKTCFACGQKVGRVDKFGLARRPIDFKSYLVFLLSLLMLAGYIWKKFF